MDLFLHTCGLFHNSTLFSQILYPVIPCRQGELHRLQQQGYLLTIFKPWVAGPAILFIFILGRIQLSYMLFSLIVSPFMMFILLLLCPFNFFVFLSFPFTQLIYPTCP